jgi:hypothetical protein
MMTGATTTDSVTTGSGAFSLVSLQSFSVSALTALMGQAWWLIRCHKKGIVRLFMLPVVCHALLAIIGMATAKAITPSPAGITLGVVLVLLHTGAILLYFLAAKKLFWEYFQSFYTIPFSTASAGEEPCSEASELLTLSQKAHTIEPKSKTFKETLKEWRSLLLFSGLYSAGSALNMVIFILGFVLSLLLMLSARSVEWPLLKMGLLGSGFLLFSVWCILMLGLFGFQSVLFLFPLIQQSIITPLQKTGLKSLHLKIRHPVFSDVVWSGVRLACHRPLESALYAALLWVVSITLLLTWWSPFMLFAGGFLALENPTILREPLALILPNAMPVGLQLLALLWGEGSWLLESLFLLTGFYIYWQACFNRATGWDTYYEDAFLRL